MEGKNSLVLLKEVLTFLMARLSWSSLGPPWVRLCNVLSSVGLRF